MKNIFLLFVVLSLLLLSTTIAQDKSDWKLSGQIQLRSELDGRDFSNKTYPLTFSTIRTRVGLEKFLSDKVMFFAQLQDSRTLGQGTPTSFLSNVDLHQGFVRLINPFDWELEVQAGRFQMIYGTERFFGASNWSHISRSFDGVKFTVLPKKFDLDLFALSISDPQIPINNASPSAYSYPAKENKSFSLYGFYKKSVLTSKSKLDLFGYYEVDRKDVKPDTNEISRLTLGGTYWGNYGDFSTLVEAAYQFGKISGVNLAAYLLSVSGSYKSGISTFTAGADILSGNDPQDTKKVRAFSTAYGTNHKFLGYMDYFLATSGGLGVNNFYLKTNINPENSKFNIAIDLHHFLSNQKALSGKNTFGQEIDLTVVYKFIPGTSVTWGGSLFLPGDLMKAVFAPREDVAFWSYVMIVANL